MSEGGDVGPVIDVEGDGREYVIEAVGVSKKFARSLKHSLYYAVRDLGTELVGKSVRPALRDDEFWALRDVSFTLRRGEALGIIGSNGAGKSTLLKILTGIIKPTTGFIRTRGQVQSLIELSAGMNPVLTGRENIYIRSALYGIPRSVVDERFDEIVSFAELQDYIDMPVQNYSSGMKVKLGFSIAINVEPDLLILDEVLAVGDHAFKRKARKAMADLLKRNVSLVFISHHMQEVRSITSRCMWLDRGQIKGLGDTPAIIDAYMSSVSPGRTRQNPQEPPFEFVARRVGEVTIEAVSSDMLSMPQRLIQLHGPHKERVVRLSLMLTSRSRIKEPVIHEWSIRDCVTDEAHGYVCLRGVGDFHAGVPVPSEFEVDLGSLHPGFYKLGYSLRPDTGSALEGVTNLAYVEVKNPTTDVGSDGEYFARMLDNSRGVFRLSVRNATVGDGR